MSGRLGLMFRRWKDSHTNGHANGKAHPAGAVPLSIAVPTAPTEPIWYRQYERAGIARHLNYPSTTLGRMLDQTADRFPDSVAIIYNHKEWTYRELLAQVNRMAGALARLGVRKNERVVMTLPNCPEFILIFFAIQKLGAVVVNAGPLMGADDLQTLITMTSPRVVIGLDLRAAVLASAGKGSTVEHWVWVSLQSYQSMLQRIGYQFKLWQGREAANGAGGHITLAQLLADAPAKPPTLDPVMDATAVLQPTGGTTGSLKLAQLSHRSLIANAMQILAWMRTPIGQERVLSALPMFHVYGLTTALINPVFAGDTMILQTRFNAFQAIELLREYKPTVFPLVPAICDAISDELEHDSEAAPISSLRLCISGAAPLPQEVAERFERLTGAILIEGYGLTEASPVTHANLPGESRYGSIGLPLPDTDCRIVDLDDPAHDVMPGDAGELLIAGPQLMTGYFANLEETHRVLTTDETGRTWLRTGDVARIDDEGYFHILDRKKDLIIHSGLKIYPARVEHVLRMHPAVNDVAVIGRPDAVHTENVTAFIVLKDPSQNHRPILAAELQALCREHLSPYEVPAKVEFTDQIPRSALGKVLKKELRKMPEISVPIDSDGHDPDRYGPTLKAKEAV